MVGTLFNVVQTKKTRTGQDILESTKGERVGVHTCVSCVSVECACTCTGCCVIMCVFMHGSIFAHTYIGTALTDRNDSVTKCYLS